MNDDVERGASRAADGGHVPPACNSLAEFVRTLEDGQFDADCYGAIKELSAALNESAWGTGGIAKGKVTITLDFRQEGGITEIRSAFKVVEPVTVRQKSVLFTTEDHRFTLTRPGQGQLFGVRDVTGGVELRG